MASRHHFLSSRRHVTPQPFHAVPSSSSSSSVQIIEQHDPTAVAVKSISPSQSDSPQHVYIHGANFKDPITIAWTDVEGKTFQSKNFTVYSLDQIGVSIPEGVSNGALTLTLTSVNSKVTIPDAFKLLGPTTGAPPFISHCSVHPDVPNLYYVHGDHFSKDTTVTVDGQSVNCTRYSMQQLSVQLTD